MKTSKLIFELQEIPDGKSTRIVSLDENSLLLDDECSLQRADVQIEFYKSDHFIRTRFEVSAETELICDRSLRPFNDTVTGEYEILFYPDSVEEHETEKGKVKQINPDHLTISIDEEVRDTIMLQIPVRKIHPDLLNQDGTPGDFKTKTFGAAGEGGSGGNDQQIDPRWEELKKLK